MPHCWQGPPGRGQGEGISNVIPALNHTLLLWLQVFVRRRWGKLDNLQKISLLWKLSCFYNLHTSRYLLQVGEPWWLEPPCSIQVILDLGAGSWTGLLQPRGAESQFEISILHSWGLSQLQPISLWNSRAGAARGRCCHLLSTVQFSTINFIHHHHQHEALQLCTVGSASC